MSEQQAVRVADIFARAIELIDPDPDNCRDIDSAVARADIEEIALSIKERGFDPDRALLVRKLKNGRYMVTDGHKRREAVLRAIELGADIRMVPCRSEEKGTDETDRAILRLRAPGRELSPLEASIDIKRLLGWNWTEKAIASKLGKPVDWVRRCLELAGAPVEIRAAVKAGEIAPTEARKIVRESADPVATLSDAREHARGAGRERVRPRDVAAVTRRSAKPSIKSRSEAIVRIWRTTIDRSGVPSALTAALDDLVEEIDYEMKGNGHVHGPDTGTSARIDA